METRKPAASAAVTLECISESISRSTVGLRGQKVMLDADLAALYAAEIRALNQAELPAEWQGVEPILRILRKGAGMASEILG